MKLVISLFTFFLIQVVFSQEKGQQYISTNFNGNGSVVAKAPTKGDTQGSMYFYEQFSAVKVGGLLQDFLARYNAYEDRMEFKDGDKVYEYFPNIHDKEFQIINLDKTYTYLTYFLDETRSENGYLITVQKGKKYNLYKKEKIKFQEGRVSQTGYDKTIPDKYVPVKGEFFMGIEGDKIIKIPKSKKDFAKLFNDKEKAALGLINAGKYSLKDEVDLKKLIIQLNANF